MANPWLTQWWPGGDYILDGPEFCARRLWGKTPKLDVTLHIGAHRSGTTTLQRFLRANRCCLDDHDIGYWGPERTRSGLFSGLFKNPAHVTRDSLRRARRSSGLIQIELERFERSGMKELIVSEENMLGGLLENISRCRLYPNAGDRLARFRRGFSGRRLRIALSIRSYDSYWTSAFGFAVMRGYDVPGTPVLDRMVTQPRRWRTIILALAEVFPEAEIIVWPFEVFGGLPDMQLQMLSRAENIQGLRHRRCWLNASATCDKLRKALAERGSDPGQIKGDHGRWKPFGADHIMALRGQYGEDLAWLRSGGAANVTFIPDVQTHERRAGEERGCDYGDIERQLG